MRIGYTKTVALCFTVKDAEGLMWSVNLICNSWAVAGAWEGNVYKLSPIFMRIHCQMEQLDHKLDGIMQAQRESGGYQYHKRVTLGSIHNLVLDDQCPWEEFCCGGDVIRRRMRLPAAPVRDLHFSAPATITYLYYQELMDEKKTIELVLMAAYHNGYDRYYDLGKKHLAKLVDTNSHPSLTYNNLAVEQYGVPFGSAQVGQISPSGVNYKEVYLNDNGDVNKVMDNVVEGILTQDSMSHQRNG